MMTEPNINTQLSLSIQQLLKSQCEERNKNAQSYKSYFFRSTHQSTDPSPCHSSQTKKVFRTRSKANNKNSFIKQSYIEQNESELTQKYEIQILRQQNMDLKKIITELKVRKMYDFDQKKIRQFIMELDQTRKQLKEAKILIENLRIQNDFFERTNLQLKRQIMKFHKNLAAKTTEKATIASPTKQKFNIYSNSQQFFKNKNVIQSKQIIKNNLPKNPQQAQKNKIYNQICQRQAIYKKRGQSNQTAHFKSEKLINSQKLLQELNQYAKIRKGLK